MAETEAAIPQIGSLVKDTALDGEKVRVDEILNKEIVVCGFKITASKYKDKGCGYCSKVQFYFVDDANKTRKVFFSGSIRDKVNGITPMPCGLLSAESVSLA